MPVQPLSSISHVQIHTFMRWSFIFRGAKLCTYLLAAQHVTVSIFLFGQNKIARISLNQTTQLCTGRHVVRNEKSWWPKLSGHTSSQVASLQLDKQVGFGFSFSSSRSLLHHKSTSRSLTETKHQLGAVEMKYKSFNEELESLVGGSKLSNLNQSLAMASQAPTGTRHRSYDESHEYPIHP